MRMKKLLLGFATATIFSSAAFAATATVEFKDGSDTITLLDNGTAVCSNGNCSAWGVLGDNNPTVGTINLIATAFDGWSITYSGKSGSPSCSPGGQCTTDTNITTQSSGAGTLDTFFADSGFTAEPGFTTSLTTSLDSAGTSVSSKFYAYTGALDLGAPPSGQIGGTLSLSSGTGSTTGGGANPAGSPFDLQDAVVLTATGANQNFTVTSTIDAVPEPSSIMLFGTVLLGLGVVLRRRKSVNS